jgi:hypothetical protein
VKIVCLFQLVRGGGGVVAAVEESTAVFLPGSAREFHPLHVIGQVLARGDVADFPFLPVRAGDREAVSDQFPVVGHGRSAERYGAVL